MNTQNILILLLITAPLIFAPAYGFNITRLLDQHPEFGNFNSLLSKTGVASAVNSRQTITVLVLDDSQSLRLNALSAEVIREIMAIHVSLSYYDREQFDAFSKNRSAIMTTLYQTTGKAKWGEGFVNVSVHQGNIKFTPAVRGAQSDTQLVRIVAAQPYNISVIEVSSPIVPPGLAELGPAAAPAPRKVGPPPPPHHPFPPSPADGPDADSPDANDDDSPSPSPSEAPVGVPPGEAPSAEDYADREEPKKKKSSGSRVVASSGLLLVAAVLAALVPL